MAADTDLIADISAYLAQPVPHVAEHESASLLGRALKALQRTSAAPELVDGAAERGAFEHWFSWGDPACPSIRRSGDGYSLMATNSAWRVWEARAALAMREHAA